jgi:O-6-methylguanine DNA methyltransferase
MTSDHTNDSYINGSNINDNHTTGDFAEDFVAAQLATQLTTTPNPPGDLDDARTQRPEDIITDEILSARLSALAVDGPAGLLGRIAATWVRVPSAAGDLYVASTHLGISYVRTSHSVHDDDAEFAALFHRRFTRPLLAGARPPAGLVPALHAQRAAKLRFDLSQLSPFEREVLLAVLTIPRGQVRPYAWVAHQIGRPKAVRAVGSALGRNPVPVLIPCHRVIRSDGTLGDYVFGPPVKRDLLDAEGTNVGEVYELAQHHIHYVGSDTTGVVCFPTCANARRITEPHRHGFRSIAEADAAGYRPCQHCRPVGNEVA